ASRPFRCSEISRAHTIRYRWKAHGSSGVARKNIPLRPCKSKKYSSFAPIFRVQFESSAQMKRSILLEGQKFQITIQRLCHQLIENHVDFSDAVIVGIQPRGIYLGRRIVEELQQIPGLSDVAYGELDITFFRDDFRRKDSGLLVPSSTTMDFIVEGKKVILMDDVLWTGRTIRAAMDA